MSPVRSCLLIATSAALITGVLAAQDVPPLYENLGTLHRPITTRVALAQRYFDQGLRLSYAFNHAEGIAAFRQAAALDTTCAMCWWGVAWALGPNINAAMDSASGVAAWQAAQAALGRIGRANAREAAMIRAMAARYVAVPGPDRAALDSAYQVSMARLADRYPDDPDLQVAAADAQMLLSPWNYWTEGKPRPGTEALLARLERVQRLTPEHPGGCHFYIHAVEAVYPERAVPCAERLAALMPGAGHLVHMPGHIYIRVGRYADAIHANEHAVHADEAFIADRHPEGLYPLGYYPHNYHFLEFAAQMAGQSAVARAAADRLVGLMDPDVLASPGLEMLQHFDGAALRVALRFGDWDAVLAAPPPREDLVYAKATWHWARAMAFARKGDPAAEDELGRLRELMATPAVGNIVIWGINGARPVLEVGVHMVLAAREESAGHADAVVTHYEEAVRLEDALLYDEPPTWELPVRPYLGAALLAASRPADAERVYREDLARFRDNGWSLFGVAAALDAQGRTVEADAVRARLATAWAGADIRLTASRF